MNRGFTLLELMITLAIIGILLAIVIPAFFGYKNSHQSKTSTTDVDYYKNNKVNRTYIENNKRSSDTLTLKRHSDGQLYACDSADVCKKVAQ